jgi:signal transduction histidine kinase
MIARIRGLLWPRSLQGQLLLAVAMALLLAQTISAVLLYRAQNDRREAALIHTATIRLFAAPIAPGEARNPGAEAELREIMAGQGLQLGQVMVVQRPISDDPRLLKRLQRRAQMLGGQGRGSPPHLLVAAIELPQAKRWLTVRVPAPRPDPALLFTLIGQTLLLYALLFGAIALIVGRITRPLAALTGRVERFAERRDTAGQLEPKGPQDMQRLILAHNAMENSIAALLDEKDVMLGAIGHDLKTPLAALRVRIESVEDETERAKMAATIEDITRSLDDILSLARVGRPTDPLELTELNALVGQVAEEFEDMGEPVSFAPAERTVVRLRETWLRRAVRNLVVNALRYGKVARIAIVRDQAQVLIRIEDDGPGIAADQIEPMMQPFTRAEPSRNSATGGAGLGLTLARAIAEQHGGTLALANRLGADGKVTGLTATLTLPLT